MESAINVNQGRKLMKKLIFSLVILIGSFQFVAAQEATALSDSTIYVSVNLQDGTSFIGELVAEDTTHIIVSNASLGEVTLERTKLKSYERLPAGSFNNGVYYHKTVNTSRNIFAPTGYGLKKGEGYYQNFMLVMNQVSYGVSDYFSMGITFEIVSLLAQINESSESGSPGQNVPAFMLTPKFSIPGKREDLNFGVGAIVLHLPYTDNFFDAAGIYGVSTWGSTESNFTVGLGIGATQSGLNNWPLITISGNHRIGKRISFITENWFTKSENSTTMFNSAGVRYLGDRIAVDFALTGGVVSETSSNGETEINAGIIPIPLVGLTIPFGEGWKK